MRKTLLQLSTFRYEMTTAQKTKTASRGFCFLVTFSSVRFPRTKFLLQRLKGKRIILCQSANPSEEYK